MKNTQEETMKKWAPILESMGQTNSHWEPHIELTNSNCDDPWTRIIMSQLSGDITKDWLTFQSYIRDNKIDELLKK